MGAAAVTELARRAPRSTSSTSRRPPVEVAGYHDTDLRDPDAVARTVEKIGGEVNALFDCAGSPGGSPRRRRHDRELPLVSHLAELVVPLMPPGSAIASISSTAGIG